MSDPLRTDHPHASHDASVVDRDAKIEQLLLVGLDQYFAAHYEQAINVWTRALFLDRSHARARAYIDRARSALAERQRESEEILRNGVAAFDRGEPIEARRLLQTAIDRGAPSEEAFAVLERLNRLESVAPAVALVEPPPRRLAPRIGVRAGRRFAAPLAAWTLAAAMLGLLGWASWTSRIDWRSLIAFARAGGADAPAVRLTTPVVREAALPLPRRGEESLSRARSLAASGHLHDALAALDMVRPTDPQRADADRLRGDIQRQLLSLTILPSVSADRAPAERRTP